MQEKLIEFKTSKETEEKTYQKKILAIRKKFEARKAKIVANKRRKHCSKPPDLELFYEVQKWVNSL